MDHSVHNKIVSFIWSIADDCLRDVFVRGKYRDVILPMFVLRRLDCLLEPSKEAVLEEVTVTATPVQVLTTVQLDAVLGSGFGIFNGTAVQWAVLRFTPARAQYVSKQVWHPEQKALWLDDGSYELQVPFTDTRELINEIMWHGPNVKVVGPQSLVSAVCVDLTAALDCYHQAS